MKALLLVVLFLATPVAAEDWFSYSLEHPDHKAIHLFGSGFLMFDAECFTKGDFWLSLPVGTAMAWKEFDDMDHGEPFTYALGDWGLDLTGDLLGAKLYDVLSFSYYHHTTEANLTFRF